VHLSNNAISCRIQHIAEYLNDQLIEKWGWLCPIWFHDLRKCGAINRLIHPTNYYNYKLNLFNYISLWSKMCFNYFYLTFEKKYWLFKVYLLEFDIGREIGFNKGAENRKSFDSSGLTLPRTSCLRCFHEGPFPEGKEPSNLMRLGPVRTTRVLSVKNGCCFAWQRLYSD
jgi:hypothetical protein